MVEENTTQSKKCCIVGCDRKGRGIGRAAGLDLVYCALHEDYGIRVLNFLINSVFREKLGRWLRTVRKDIFKEDEIEFCEHCAKKIEEYVSRKIVELQKLEVMESQMDNPEENKGCIKNE